MLAAALGLASAAAFAAGPPTLIPGFLKFEAYTNITTTAVQALLDDPNYPNSPGETLYLTSFDTRTVYPNDAHENYGGRISGFVTPVESGDYEFFLRSDDASQLFISPDDNPANLAQVAEEAGCCNAFMETGDPKTSPPQTLVAGRRYAIQVLYKEGGGGDFAQVAWRKAGDTTAAARLLPIPGAFLSAMIPSDGTITIATQPANITAAQNDFITLSLVATSTGPAPLVVQWRKNGVNLPGVTGASARIGPIPASDNNAKFSAVLSIPGATTTSGEATLTVTADVTPPSITRVAASDSFDSVTVDFSEAVTAASAGATANYTLDNGLTVSQATVLSPTRVQLTTSRQALGTTYNLSVKDVTDTGGVKIAADTRQSFSSFANIRGGLKLEVFNDIATTAVQALLDDPKYQANTPDRVAYVPQFSSRFTLPDNQSGLAARDNYGGRLSGWIVPKENGDYEFFIRSDDASQLFLSTDDKPENAVMIAEETGCCGPFEDNSDATAPHTETSAPIALVANNRYYIMALWKEGGGGDYADVAWRKAGDTTLPRSLPYIQGDVLETIAAPGTFTVPTVAIASPANNSAVPVGSPVVLTATASAASGKTIASVEYFELGQSRGVATTSPFTVTVQNLSEDVHVFTARASDSAGMVADSAPVSVSVGTPVRKITLLAINTNTFWKYDRSGQDLGEEWRQINYNDTAWPQGLALIADETTTTVEPIRTPISRFTDADQTYIKTFYFRGTFNWTDPIDPAGKLSLRHVVDDGAVIYLNGREIHRFNIAAGVVVDATTDASGHENAYEGPYDIPITNLVAGKNVLAIEVHNSGGSSSDIVFGAELTATVPLGTPPGGQPVLTITRSGTGLQISWTEGGTLQSSDTVTTGWVDMPGNSPQTIAPGTTGAKFYRVRK